MGDISCILVFKLLACCGEWAGVVWEGQVHVLKVLASLVFVADSKLSEHLPSLKFCK